ncbi:hypothetical protein FRC10_005262 [Ceratobasidium sp. 414]|nr:hypothetical protein FRC10_005262 [Ceratobasidium sp. 414]
MNTSASKFDDFVYAHMDSNVKDHFTGIFLPWHRWYLHTFENALRTRCDYKGTLPFWDWSRDTAHIPDSPVFNSSKTYGLGTFGTNASNPEVTDGAFGTAVRAYPTPHLIKRKFNPYPFRTKVFPFEFLKPDMRATDAFTPSAIKAVVGGSKGNFTDFAYKMDGGVYIGLLYLWHLDCIWARWQARRKENRNAFGGGLTQDLEHYDQYPVGAPPTAKLSSDLPTVGLSGPVSVEDVMQTKGGYLCYKSHTLRCICSVPTYHMSRTIYIQDRAFQGDSMFHLRFVTHLAAEIRDLFVQPTRGSKGTQNAAEPLSLPTVDHDQQRSFPMPHSSNTWPHASLAPGHARPTLPRRDTWTPGARFDPFGPSTANGGTATSVWAATPPVFSLPRPSADLLSPRAQQPVPSDRDGASPEHISIMLRSLGITPSPAASPAPILLDSPSSITPPALSPTTQIMSMGSNSSIRTPTPARVAEPLFTPTSTSFDRVSLFDAETPTKARLRLSTELDELVPHSQSRKSTVGASQTLMNLAPRHVALALQSSGAVPSGPASPTISHQRVLSWMERQGLSSVQPSIVGSNSLFGGNVAPAPAPRQDWVFGSPRMSMPPLNTLPAWDRVVPPSQPQPQPQLQGMSASMWAPRPPVLPTAGFPGRDERKMSEPTLNEPINFLRLLQPSSQPPYALFVTRIVKNSDQQASIFLQQKLKAATSEDARRPIIDAIVAQGFDMMTNRFGNWAIQRCLEAPCTLAERTRVAEVMKGRVIELATNCYGTHVVQKALDCAQDTQLFVVAEMLQGDLATTLMNKHASHVWTKIMEVCERRVSMMSLIVQHAFENLEESDKADCVREVLESIGTLAVDQWGMLENGTDDDRAEAVDALVEHISTLSTDPQGVKAIEKAIKSGGPQAVGKIVRRLSEPAKSGRRPLVVDLALGSAGSQLISMLLPLLSNAQWVMLHDSVSVSNGLVKGHIVTMKGSKSGSRVVWLFERMKSQHGN